MLVKDLNIRSLVTGDKQARLTLETLKPEDITEIAKLAEEIEIEVEFKIDKSKKK